MGLELEELFTRGGRQGPDVVGVDGALRWRSGGGRARRATANEVKQGAKVLGARYSFIVRGHGEDVVARSPLVVPDLPPWERRSLVEGESARLVAGKGCGAKAICVKSLGVLRTRTERGARGGRRTLVVAVVADVVPVVRGSGNRTGDLFSVGTGDDRNRDGLGWSLDCLDRHLQLVKLPAVSEFAGWTRSKGRRGRLESGSRRRIEEGI